MSSLNHKEEGVSASPRQVRKLVSIDDLQRLTQYAQRLGDEPRRTPPLGEDLLELLAEAEAVPRAMLPNDVVRLGSIVHYEDDVTNERRRVALCGPGEEHPTEPTVPVLTPIGMAILGARRGEYLQWRSVLGGWRGATILQVTPSSLQDA